MKAGKSQKVQGNEGNKMSDEAFADLKEAIEDALAFERGECRELKMTRIPARQLRVNLTANIRD